MIKSFKTKTATIAAIGVIGLGGAGAAVAATSGAPTPLTGSITDKASTAALAKYPGSTLVGIRSQPDGSYVADVRKSDGTTVLVELDKDFKVTGTREGGFGGRGGHGGPGGFGRGVDTAALAKTLGVTEAKLQAAFEATRPTKDERKADREGDRDAHRDAKATALAKELGIDAAKVKSALEDLKPAGRP